MLSSQQALGETLAWLVFADLSFRFMRAQDALSDAGNLLINIGVVAGAAFLLKKDLDGRAELLEEVAIELGEKRAAVQDEETSEKTDEMSDVELIMDATEPSARQPKKKKKRRKKAA